jgi:hypothetical protein
MRSALWAGEWIDLYLAGKAPDIRVLRDRFASLWRARRAACRAMGLLISNPATASFMIAAAEATPALRNLSLRLIGKTDARFAAPVG